MSETALSVRTAALLDARAAALAGRTIDQAPAAAVTAFLVCACGPERYGLPLAAVAGVTPERPCTALPGAPATFRGIAATAGVIVSVLDLSACLGLDGAGGASGHFVRLRGPDPPVVLAVDRVVGIAQIEAAALHSDPSEAQALGGRPLLGYAPPGSDRTGDVRDGFAILDLPALLARFLA
ncbi:chemotaxis protein CheW [Methylobacterium sp. Leaf118]|uniref:chemotaxis protein CheW n=1 Tax=Methylobacterium sp. Leaf118 TaxID=2876562 RepID=UPI001E638AC3|nr:chemotaxis protein CheW [Methylobacterium sp. Leaf118]